jgi:hypothetical protein
LYEKESKITWLGIEQVCPPPSSNMTIITATGEGKKKDIKYYN